MKIKNIFLPTLLGICMLSSCSDDDTLDETNGVPSNVPSNVQQAFNDRFPNVKEVQWDVVKDYHVARFNAPIKGRSTANSFTTNAWFTQEGQYCQADEDIEFANLPMAVQDAFNLYKETMYPDWEIDDCELVIREGMSPIFVIEIEKGDLEREISVSEFGDILKDVLDDDDEDEILPILIPEKINTVLQEIFPETFEELSILELEIDDDEIEIDVIESGKHKEIELDAQYNLVSIEYEVSFVEAQQLMNEEVFLKLVELAQLAGIDILDENIQKDIEIEVKETSEGYKFEVEIELGDAEFEVEIDENGNIKMKD